MGQKGPQIPICAEERLDLFGGDGMQRHMFGYERHTCTMPLAWNQSHGVTAQLQAALVTLL